VFEPATAKREKLLWKVPFTVAFLFLLALLLLPGHSAKALGPSVRLTKLNGVTNGAANERSMPFRIGETLNYQVTWAGFTSAAKVELSVTEHRQILGWMTWHFRASAHTLSPLRSFLSLDDQIDSYADSKTLESRQYETHLSEMGSIENQISHLSALGLPHHAGISGVAVLPGTLDPLGALYILRTVDWRQTAEFRAPVYDGQDVLEVRARQEVANETVAVDAGNFSAARISVQLYKRSEVTRESCTVWLANDLSRTPVLLQAELPLGSVQVELASTPR
jgi:Protein of unknown function (DUF3108)